MDDRAGKNAQERGASSVFFPAARPFFPCRNATEDRRCGKLTEKSALRLPKYFSMSQPDREIATGVTALFVPVHVRIYEVRVAGYVASDDASYSAMLPYICPPSACVVRHCNNSNSDNGGERGAPCY